MSSKEEASLPPLAPNNEIAYDTYKSEEELPQLMEMFAKYLSEPYSIFTYRYFINTWPELCVIARDIVTREAVGAIVCKLEKHTNGKNRGYIAMLAVNTAYRKRGIGSTLVKKAIENMKNQGCEEVVLETEVTNKGSLGLYGKLGFIRDKRLHKYYLNGVDAFRLKIFLSSPSGEK